MQRSLVSSHALPALRRVLSQDTALPAALDAPRLRVVVDANIALRELYWIHKTRRDAEAKSHFREVVDAGVIVPYAPPQLEREVVSHFDYLHDKHGIARDALRGSWSELRALLKWVSPRHVARHSSQLRAIMRRDPKDAPYVALAIQIGAAGVLTWDQDFGAAGVAICDSTAVSALRTQARSAATELAAVAAGCATLGITVGVARTAWSTFRCLPPLVQFGIVTLGIGAIVGALRLPRTGRRNGLALLSHGLVSAFEGLAEARTARLAQPVVGLVNRRPCALVDFAAVICAEAASPVAVQDIASRAIAAGYSTRSRQLHVYLRQLLGADRRFARHGRHAWALASI